MPWILDHAEKFVKELKSFEEQPDNMIMNNYKQISDIHQKRITQHNNRRQD